MSTRDRHPTERMQLTELHGLGTWPVAVAALDAVGPGWLLIFRRAVLAEIRAITILMESESYEPSLIDRLDHMTHVLRHLGHEPSLAMPSAPAAPPPAEPPPDDPTSTP